MRTQSPIDLAREQRIQKLQAFYSKKPEARPHKAVRQAAGEKKITRLQERIAELYQRIEWIRAHPQGWHRKRPVICVETGKRYESIQEAAKDTGIPFMTIQGAACKGRCLRGWMHFTFANGSRVPLKPSKRVPIVRESDGAVFLTIGEGARSVGLMDREGYFRVRNALTYGHVVAGSTWRRATRVDMEAWFARMRREVA